MPERPWQQILDAQIASSRTNERAPRRSTALNYPQSLYVHVLGAAQARDMSMAAYQRRAVLAFAQHDTGFDWYASMADEPAIAAFGGGPLRGELNGLGCGYWKIVELGEW